MRCGSCLRRDARRSDVLREKPLVQREHRHRRDTDARAVRGGLAGNGQPLHFPDVRYLVLAAARRTRTAVRLHREARNQQTVGQSAQRVDVARRDASRNLRASP